MSPGPDFLLLLLTLLLTTCPTMSLAQSAVRISTTEASSSSRSDFPPTLLTKSAIAYNDGDGDALGNDGDDEPEPFPEPFSVRRSAAIAYIDDDSEALRLDDEAFVFSTSTSTAITATTITSTTTTSYPDTSTYEYCVNDEASCGKDDLCSDCHLLTTSGGSLTCQEAYPAAAASGISSACEQLAATFCCYYGNASAAQRCLGNEPTALYWEVSAHTRGALRLCVLSKRSRPPSRKPEAVGFLKIYIRTSKEGPRFRDNTTIDGNVLE